MIIRRVSQNKFGTFGALICDKGYPIAVTYELPWKDNLPNISCIPAGQYICKRVKSNHFGDVFEITDVDGRTHILIHKGNRKRDTKGCIVVGEKYDHLGGEPAILNSKGGFDEFMAMVQGVDTFPLYVISK